MKLRSGRIIGSTATPSAPIKKTTPILPVIIPLSDTLYKHDKKAFCVETIKQLLDAYSLCFSQDDRAIVSLSLFHFINTNFDFIASPQFNGTTRFIKAVYDKSIELKSQMYLKTLGTNIDPMYSALSELLDIVKDKCHKCLN